MSSFQPSPPAPLRPPPPLPPPGTKISESEIARVVEQAYTVAAKGLSWCVDACKKSALRSDDYFDAPCLVLGGLAFCVVSLDTLGLAPVLLPPKAKGFVVNVWGFARPALATIGDSDKTKKPNGSTLLSSPLTSYWVVFGLFSVLDGILSTVTPFYLLTKACLLTWSVSSKRPYGGRPVLEHAFEMINANHPNALGSNQQQQPTSIRADSIPWRAFRLAVAVAAFAAATLAFGVLVSVVLVMEGVLAGQPAWTQARICAIAGSSWPLCATLTTMARTTSAQGAGVDNNGKSNNNSDNKQRQGPAAVQWLSYWPLYTISLVAIDPVMGWSPHYYSAKLVTLAFLALPQTRGAYLIASFLLHGNRSAGDPDRVTAAGG